MSTATSNATRKLMSTNPPTKPRKAQLTKPNTGTSTVPATPVVAVTAPQPVSAAVATPVAPLPTNPTDALRQGTLVAGTTKLVWHQAGGTKPGRKVPVTYVGPDKHHTDRMLVHEHVNDRVTLRSLPTWVLTRKGGK